MPIISEPGNPGERSIVDRAEEAIRSWSGVSTVEQAAALLDSWKYARDLTAEQRAQVLARFAQSGEFWRGYEAALADAGTDDTADAAPRPFWMPEPCPTWCEFGTYHADDAMPEDRSHWASAGEPIELTLMPVVRHDETGHPPTPAVVLVDLSQHVEHAAPRVMVTVGQGPVYLTIAEARELAGQLAALALLAEG